VQSALLKRAEDTEGDAAEASATKLRLQQQNSMALTVVPESQTANGSAHPPILRPSVSPVHTVSPLIPEAAGGHEIRLVISIVIGVRSQQFFTAHSD